LGGEAKMTKGEISKEMRRFSPGEKEKWLVEVAKVYDEMRRKQSQGPYDIEIEGRSFSVHPEVYAPLFFTDTEFLYRELPEIVGEGSLLEMGCGTGVLGIACALNGAEKVVMTDINPAASENASVNVWYNDIRKKIEVREGNMYENIRVEEKFDNIFWSHPYNRSEEPVEDMLMISGFDYKSRGIAGYIEGAKNHLTEGGRLLLGTGDSADLDIIENIAEANGYVPKILKKIEMSLGVGSEDTIKNYIVQINGGVD
jgi:methylase of polypeptide subunit release factors